MDDREGAVTTTTTAPFKRTVKVGTIDTGYKGRAVVSVDIEWDGKRLSISGEAKRPGAADLDSCGQIIDDVTAVDVEHLSLDPADRDRLVAEWKRWHLNDMRAGCSHQRDQGWDKRRIDPAKPTDVYGVHFEGQRSPSWNLAGWVRPDEHPEGLLTKPCPTCGYRYGTAWLTEDVPAEVVEWLRDVAT